MINDKLKRDSNFELLRIFAMLGIVFSHFCYTSNIETVTGQVNIAFVYLITLFGRLGVDIFVMISGYFLVNSNALKFSKIMRLIGEVFFYSVAGFLISYLVGDNTISFKSILSAITPIISERWWFASSYFVLFIIHPALNKIVYAYDRKSFKKVVLTAVILWSVIPTITGTTFQSNMLITFIVFYFVGAYIRIEKEEIKLSKRACCSLSFALIVSMLASIYAMQFADKIVSGLGANKFCFISSNSILPLLAAFFTVLGVSKSKPFSNKVVNVLASASFGVYLIHDNSYIRQYVWKLFNVLNGNINTPMFIIKCVATVLIIFVACVAIDLIRINTLERLYMKVIFSIENKLTRKKTDA